MPRTNLQRRSVIRIDRLKGVLLTAMQDNCVTWKEFAELIGVSATTGQRLAKKPSAEWSIGEVVTLLDRVGADTVELSFNCGVDNAGNPVKEIVRLL